MVKPHMGNPRAQRFVREAPVRFEHDPQVVALRKRMGAGHPAAPAEEVQDMAASPASLRKETMAYLRGRPVHTDGRASATAEHLAETTGWDVETANSVLSALCGEVGSGVRRIGRKESMVYDFSAEVADRAPAKKKREIKHRGARQFWLAHVKAQPAGTYLATDDLAAKSGQPRNTVSSSLKWIFDNVKGELRRVNSSLYEVLKPAENGAVPVASAGGQVQSTTKVEPPPAPAAEQQTVAGSFEQELLEMWRSGKLQVVDSPADPPAGSLTEQWPWVEEPVPSALGPSAAALQTQVTPSALTPWGDSPDAWPEGWFRRLATTSTGLVIAEDGHDGVYELRKLN